MDDFVYLTKIKVRNCKVEPSFVCYSVVAKPCFQSYYRGIVPPVLLLSLFTPVLLFPPGLLIPCFLLRVYFPCPLTLEYFSQLPHPRRDAFSLIEQFSSTNHLYFVEMQIICESHDIGKSENPGVSLKFEVCS